MNDDILAALNAERYGTPGWFTRKPADRPVAPEFDDSDLTCARRRRELLAAHMSDDEIEETA